MSKSLYHREIEKSSFKAWDQDPLKPLPISDIIKMYENGFAGSICSEEAEEELLNTLEIPYGSDVARLYNFEDIGKDQLVFPLQHVIEAYPNSFPGKPQTRGSCFLAGTMVTMSDGSKKPIEQISVGERVVTHKNIQKVYELIEKKYDDDLIEFKTPSFNKTIKSTKEHKFPILKKKGDKTLIWKTAHEIQIGDWLILGRPRVEAKEIIFDLKEYGANVVDSTNFIELRLEPVEEGKCRSKGSATRQNRFIKFDEKFAYILGAFLAEGSCDIRNGEPSRISFNINSSENFFKEKIISYIKDVFDIECTERNPKTSVTTIRFCSKPIAKLLYTLCGNGNVYSKCPPWQALGLSKSIKLNLLQGWIDGDGYFRENCTKNGKKYKSRKIIAVSASHKLINGMQEIANSCGLLCTINTRKARKQSKIAWNLNFYGENALALKKQQKAQIDIELNNCEYGIPVQIKEKNLIPYEGKVYCINVENDHSFIANGYLTHNCVADNAALSSRCTMVLEAVLGIPDEVTGLLEEIPKVSEVAERNNVVAFEPLYWFRGHGGDGWNCSQVVRVLTSKCGVILRRNYTEFGLNLEEYSGNLAGKWGRTPPPEEVSRHLNKNLFRTATKVRTFEEVRDFLKKGFFIITCGSQGWANGRDENGFSRRQGGWAHALQVGGADDRPEIKKIYGEPLVLVNNTWGAYNKDKNGLRKIYGTNFTIPDGSFWAKWSDFQNREMFAISGLNGWARKELPDLSPGAV